MSIRSALNDSPMLIFDWPALRSKKMIGCSAGVTPRMRQRRSSSSSTAYPFAVSVAGCNFSRTSLR